MDILDRLTDEEYFDALKELFLTKGWEVFLAELSSNSVHINSVEDTSSDQDLWFRKGQLAVISNVLNLERTTNMVESEEPELDVGL